MADCLGGGRLSHDASLAPRRLYHRQSSGVHAGRSSGVAPGGTSVPRVEGRLGAARHGRLRSPSMNIQAHRAEYQDVEALRGLYRQELKRYFALAVVASVWCVFTFISSISAEPQRQIAI